MEKLTKTASTLNMIFKIMEQVLFALVIAGAVFTGLIMIGWLMGWDPDMLGRGYESLDIGFLELEIAGAYAIDKWAILLQAAVMLVLGCICCLIARQIVRCIRSILDPITEGKPFSTVVSSSLKRLAVRCIALGVAVNLIGIAELLINTLIYNVPELLLSEKICHVGINYNIDVSFLIVSGILMLLSYIFRYGTELQELSDETL